MFFLRISYVYTLNLYKTCVNGTCMFEQMRVVRNAKILKVDSIFFKL